MWAVVKVHYNAGSYSIMYVLHISVVNQFCEQASEQDQPWDHRFGFTGLFRVGYNFASFFHTFMLCQAAYTYLWTADISFLANMYQQWCVEFEIAIVI